MRFHWLAQSTAVLFALPTALGVVLTNGTTSGKRFVIPLDNGLELQSTGYASLNEARDCPASLNMGPDCVYMRLNGTGQLDEVPEGAIPRQRIELKGPPSKEKGEAWKYSWNIRLGENTTNVNRFFFHISNVLSGDDVPLYTLSLRNESVAFENPSNETTTVNCTSPAGEPSKIPVIDLRQTVKVDLSIVHGLPTGSVKWTLTDEQGKQLLKCKAFNTLVPVGTYVKTGLHRSMRRAPLGDAEAWVANWHAEVTPAGSVRYEEESTYSYSSRSSFSIVASVRSSASLGSNGGSINTESSIQASMESSVQESSSSSSSLISN